MLKWRFGTWNRPIGPTIFDVIISLTCQFLNHFSHQSQTISYTVQYLVQRHFCRWIETNVAERPIIRLHSRHLWHKPSICPFLCQFSIYQGRPLKISIHKIIRVNIDLPRSVSTARPQLPSPSSFQSSLNPDVTLNPDVVPSRMAIYINKCTIIIIYFNLLFLSLTISRRTQIAFVIKSGTNRPCSLCLKSIEEMVVERRAWPTSLVESFRLEVSLFLSMAGWLWAKQSSRFI